MAEYGPEFWAEAVRLATSPGHTRTPAVAPRPSDLRRGVRRHVHQAAVDAGASEDLHDDSEPELVRLRQENRALRLEREYIKGTGVPRRNQRDYSERIQLSRAREDHLTMTTMPRARCLPERLLGLNFSSRLQPAQRRTPA